MSTQTKHYRFFAHFNRIAMQRGSPLVWTVHFRGACLPAAEVIFRTAMHTRYRPLGRQPRATLRGWASKCVYNGNTLEVS